MNPVKKNDLTNMNNPILKNLFTKNLLSTMSVVFSNFLRFVDNIFAE